MQPSQQLACNGQPGVAKPGTDRLVYMGIGAVEAVLAELTSGIGSVAAAAWFAGKSYDILHICGNPDPGDPGMSVQDWIDLVDYARPQVSIPAGIKATQWFEHVMWPVWCNCSDGSSAPPNTPTGPPPSQPNPNSPPSVVGANCWDHSAILAPVLNGWNQATQNGIFPVIPPTVPANTNQIGIQTPLPASVQWTITANNEGSAAQTATFFFTFFDVHGTLINTAGLGPIQVQPGTTVKSPVAAVPTNAANWNTAVTGLGGSTTPSNTVNLELVIFCQGQSPTAVTSACCPPDPSVDMRLAALMDMMTQLLSLQALEGAYQDSVRHSGLSGEGTIAINPASSAIRVEIKSDLSTWPNHPQIPTYYLSLGFVTPFAVGTPLKGQRIVYQHQTFTWPSYTDTIGYTFAAGLVVDLVELTRGA